LISTTRHGDSQRTHLSVKIRSSDHLGVTNRQLPKGKSFTPGEVYEPKFYGGGERCFEKPPSILTQHLTKRHGAQVNYGRSKEKNGHRRRHVKGMGITHRLCTLHGGTPKPKLSRSGESLGKRVRSNEIEPKQQTRKPLPRGHKQSDTIRKGI